MECTSHTFSLSLFTLINTPLRAPPPRHAHHLDKQHNTAPCPYIELISPLLSSALIFPFLHRSMGHPSLTSFPPLNYQARSFLSPSATYVVIASKFLTYFLFFLHCCYTVISNQQQRLFFLIKQFPLINVHDYFNVDLDIIRVNYCNKNGDLHWITSLAFLSNAVYMK